MDRSGGVFGEENVSAEEEDEVGAGERGHGWAVMGPEAQGWGCSGIDSPGTAGWSSVTGRFVQRKVKVFMLNHLQI
jgi:hypothetical protein